MSAPARALRLCAAVVGGALAFVAIYALDRTRTKLFIPAPDPGAVIASARVEYFWRCALCAWAAPIAGSAAWWTAEGREARVVSWLTRLIVPVSLAAAALAAAFP